MNTVSSFRLGVVLPAAGKSTRMAGVSKEAPSKVLLQLGSETVLERTLEVISGIPEVYCISLVVSESWKAEGEHILQRFSQRFPHLRYVTALGGDSRLSSIRNGVRALQPYWEHFTFIAVHDAARCFITKELFSAVADKATETGAAIPALPAVDTLKWVQHEVIERTITRSSVYCAQTPQIFEKELYYSALMQCSSEEEITDDASLVEKAHPVSIVKGDPRNIKLTTPVDYEWARFVINQERKDSLV